MRVSRTIVSLVLLVLTIVLKALGIDVELPNAGEVGADGWSLMTLLEVLFTVAAAYFRTQASGPTNLLGVKADNSTTNG